jgi:hypothetical protein
METKRARQKTNHMTSKQQQTQNNSPVDNDSQDERLPKHHYENPGSPAGPGAPSAQESPKGAKRKSKKAEGSSLSTAISGTNSKSWISIQQKLWKENPLPWEVYKDWWNYSAEKRKKILDQLDEEGQKHHLYDTRRKQKPDGKIWYKH